MSSAVTMATADGESLIWRARRAGDDLALDQLLERHRGQVAATLGHCRRRRQGQAQGDTQARQPDAPFMPDRDCAHHPPPLWSLHLLLRIG